MNDPKSDDDRHDDKPRHGKLPDGTHKPQRDDQPLKQMNEDPDEADDKEGTAKPKR